MKRLLFIPLMLLAVATMAQTKNADYVAYINKYKQAAVDQQIKHGIPASITLAQGLLESGAGKSTLATEANNHFGIKCHSDWTGDSIHRDDDKLQECFRKYDDAAQSFEDHSLFLSRARYKSLFELSIKDYKGWARGLKNCGYATDPNYAVKLIKIIEDYELVAITEATLLETEARAKEAEKDEKEVSKDEKTTKEKADDKATKKSKKDKKKDRKKNIVDEAFANSQTEEVKQETLTEEVTTKKKKRTSGKVGAVDLYIGHQVHRDGVKKYIEAEAGDTYRGIAAEFNIELSRLLRYNNASEYDKPKTGERIYLTGKRK